MQTFLTNKKKWNNEANILLDISKKFFDFLNKNIYNLIDNEHCVVFDNKKSIKNNVNIIASSFSGKKRIFTIYNDYKKFIPIFISFDISYTNDNSNWELNKINENNYVIHLFIQKNYEKQLKETMHKTLTNFANDNNWNELESIKIKDFNDRYIFEIEPNEILQSMKG